MENDEIKKQWHPPFCSAMRLELLEEGENLFFQNEYNLSSKPLQVDLLILPKNLQHKIKNEIGQIFLGHNLIEYKSPESALNSDTYFKTLAYACLYRGMRETIKKVSEKDITITFVREGFPKKLMKYFVRRDFTITKISNGIYHVIKKHHFPMQVIVTEKLNSKNHIWLTSLTRNLKEEQAENLILKINSLTNKYALEHAQSVLNLTMNVNKKLFSTYKDGDSMCCDALKEFFKPELDEANAKTELAISQMKQAISEKEQAVSEKEQAVSEKEQAVSEKEQAVSEKELAVSEKEQAVSEKEKAISEKEQAVSEKEKFIQNQNKKTVTTIEKMIKTFQISLMEACNMLEITVAEYRKLKKDIKLAKAA